MASRLPQPAAFAVVATTVATFLAVASAPSPLYPLYEREFGFSPAVLTVVFAVYVLALLAALLVVGRLSDHVGRRPVLAAALAVELVALVLFLLATDTTWLVLARIVQGLATGTATAVLGAYLLDLQAPGTQRGALLNSIAPAVGLSVGGLLAGTLAEYAPAPLHLVYAVLGVVVLALLVAVLVLPETVGRRPGAAASLRPVVAVPPAARRAFVAAVPAFAAVWSLGGLMLSLSGSVLASQLGVTDHAVSGLVIGTFTGVAAVVGGLARHRSAQSQTRGGLWALVAGLVLFLAALGLSSLPVLVAAVAVAGAGFGTVFLGGLRKVTADVEPHERSGLMSAVFVVSYLAFSVPALAAGVLVGLVGLSATSLGYVAVVAVVAAVALVADVVVARRTRERSPALG